MVEDEVRRFDTPNSGSESSATKSEREKVEEFAFQRNLEALRAFYQVMLLAVSCLMAGVCLTISTEVLWRILPAGVVVESIISAMAALAWFLTAVTVATLSTCPIDELNFDSFVASRRKLSAALGLLPLITGGLRVLELPFPRAISVLTGLAFIAKACTRRLPVGATTLMVVWYLDVVVSSTVNELALDEPVSPTSIWLGFHAFIWLVVVFWMHWKQWQPTIRFYIASYMTLSWNSSFFLVRAIDLVMGHKQWEEGRQTDIAIMAALSFAVFILVPLLIVLFVGRKVGYRYLSAWLEGSRRRRLQDGAFMAMLLDSYHVELSQPWWLTHQELEDAVEPRVELRRDMSLSQVPEILQKPRPGFVLGHVVMVSEDALSFTVRCSLAEGVKHVEVRRAQQVLPWPELLRLGRKNLRCVDWASQSPELWRQNRDTLGNSFQLSRPVRRGEVIDFFVSHSWSDKSDSKWRALQVVADNFFRRHGRYPTFWVDKFCIEQAQVADGLRVLPVNVMSCRKMLCLCGQTYPNRLWCAWELCVLLSFMPMETAMKQLLVIPLSKSSLLQLPAFDIARADCYDPNEELRLRLVIEAIGSFRFETKIRALGQLILDRDLAGDGLLQRSYSSLSPNSSDSEEPQHEKTLELKDNVDDFLTDLEDPVIEAVF